MHAAFTLKRPIGENSSADPADIVAAKKALLNLGLYEAPEWGLSGVPDRALFEAIRNFQQTNGLRIDGVMKPGGESETALKAMAEMVRQQGRNGDTILAHITPEEAELLHRVTDGGSINPQTGLPEFFFGFGGDDDDDQDSRDQANETGNYSTSPADDWDDAAVEASGFGFGAGHGGGDGGDNPTRQQYEQKLSTLKGIDKFVYGTKHGWKNWNSSRYNQPGVYDSELGRTLTARDFAPGGARSMDTAEGKAAAQRAVQQRAFAAELKQSAARRAQAQNVDNVTGLYALTGKPVKAPTPKTPGKTLSLPGIAPVAAPISKSSSKPKMASLAKSNPTIAEQMQTLHDIEQSKASQAKAAAKRAQEAANRPTMTEQLMAQVQEFGKTMAKNQKAQAASKAQTQSASNKSSWAQNVEQQTGYTLTPAQSPNTTQGYVSVAEGGAVSMGQEDPYMTPIGPALESFVNFVGDMVDRVTNPDRNT